MIEGESLLQQYKEYVLKELIENKRWDIASFAISKLDILRDELVNEYREYWKKNG